MTVHDITPNNGAEAFEEPPVEPVAPEVPSGPAPSAKWLELATKVSRLELANQELTDKVSILEKVIKALLKEKAMGALIPQLQAQAEAQIDKELEERGLAALAAQLK